MSYRIKTYLILGAYFLAGIIFGLAISKIPHPKLLRLPSVAQDKPNSVTIDIVKENDTLVIIEAMKMETNITASSSGTVDSIFVSAGQQVESGELLVKLK